MSSLIAQSRPVPTFAPFLRWNGVKLELLANFVGTGWAAVIQVACVPVYIKFMGIESYGLIGFYVMLQAMLQVLDLGLSPTINREMAFYSVQPEKASEARNLVRTVEVGYWIVGLLIGVGIVSASPWIASHWIKAAILSSQEIQQTVMLIGLLVIFQWPVSFYQGGLLGLRKQVPFNIVQILAVTLSNGGVVLVLWLIAHSIRAFFLWFIVVSIVRVAVLMGLLWRSLPNAIGAPQFDFRLVRNIRSFAAGMTGIAFVSLVLTQADKLLVSNLLDLKTFGYYTLASSVAGGLLLIAGCVFNAIFPRMSAMVAAGNTSAVSRFYHRSSQLMAILILPLASVFSLFSFDVLRVWTGSSDTASNAATILSIMVIGSALNALLYSPYLLQLAFGWTKLVLSFGVLAALLLVPLMFIMTKRFGPIGASSIWVLLNVLNMCIVVPIVHRRLLPNETRKYFRDIGLPVLAAFLSALLGRIIFADVSSVPSLVAVLIGQWLVSFAAAIAVAPEIRGEVIRHLITVRASYA